MREHAPARKLVEGEPAVRRAGVERAQPHVHGIGPRRDRRAQRIRRPRRRQQLDPLSHMRPFSSRTAPCPPKQSRPLGTRIHLRVFRVSKDTRAQGASRLRYRMNIYVYVVRACPGQPAGGRLWVLDSVARAVAPKRTPPPVILVSVLGFLLVAGIAFGIGMLGNVERWLSDLPDYTDADEYLVSEPSHILDAAGNEIATFFVQNRESVTADQVSPWVLKGTVDVEDERFYEHPGVDIIGIGRAVLAQLSGPLRGRLDHHPAARAQHHPLGGAVRPDHRAQGPRGLHRPGDGEDLLKDEILMMYLNCIYYGHGAYGIQAASKTYFSKNASDLTLAEAALLIGLPNSPSYYDPTVNPEVAVERRNKVLGNMLRLGTITQEEHDAAVAEPSP